MRSSAATDREVERIRKVLGTLISWMAQSANSPIRRDEAEHLLKRLEEPSPQGEAAKPEQKD